MAIQETGRWAELIEIGDVSYTGCRGELIDGGAFFDPFVGSSRQGNDGTINMQVVDRGVKGIAFGLKLVSTHQDSLIDLLAEIQAAHTNHLSIVMEITEGIIEKRLYVTKDFNQTFFTYEKYSESYYENVVFRFMSHGSAV